VAALAMLLAVWLKQLSDTPGEPPVPVEPLTSAMHIERFVN
jgi:hypothetical protein